jgi:hypothetical protein
MPVFQGMHVHSIALQQHVTLAFNTSNCKLGALRRRGEHFLKFIERGASYDRNDTSVQV